MNRSLFEAKFGAGHGPAFSEPMQPDDALSAVVGPNPLTHSELIQRMWGYIQEHGLQDEKKKMLINADATLQPVFGGRQQVTIFELTKLMSAHLRPRAA